MESPDGPTFSGGDPLLAFDGNGRAYFSTIPTFHLWRSSDGGRSWTGPVDVGRKGWSYDRPWIAASPEPSDTTLPLHAVAKTAVRGEDHLFISVSRDGGASFEEGRLVLPDSGYLQNSTDLVVRGDGTVLFPYLVHYGPGPDRRGPLGPRLRGRYHLLRSDDAGATWSGPYPVGATSGRPVPSSA